MKRWLHLIWRWSWLVTLPISGLFIYWAVHTADSFYTFGVRYDSSPIDHNIHVVGYREFLYLYRKAELITQDLFHENVSAPIELKVINLFVPDSNLAKLDSNLPHSGYDYVQGSIRNGDQIQSIKFRYRGDFVYHWGQRKKSLRVKTSKNTLFDGVRKFNLLASKQLETHFGNLLATQMGLLAPRTELVEVMLNGRLLGVHAFVEQLEELTLRTNRRIPGDLYAGETLAKDQYRGIYGKLFRYPQLWDKVAINNHYAEGSTQPLETLLSLINDADSEENHQALSRLMDMESWGRFAAFELLARTFHYGDTHNWRLYYDPMKSRFYPVVWDPNGWLISWLDESQLDIIPSALHRKLFRNAKFIRKRAEVLESFFGNGKDVEFLQNIDSLKPALINATKRDPLNTKPIAQVLENIEQFGSRVERVFDEVKQGHINSREPLKYVVKDTGESALLIKLSVSGRVPINKLDLTFKEEIKLNVTGEIAYNVDNAAMERNISGGVSTHGSSLRLEQTLIANYLPVKVGERSNFSNRVNVESAVYELTLAGIESSNQLVNIRADYGDGKLLLAERVSAIEDNSFVKLFEIIEPHPVAVPLVWHGDVVVSSVLEIHRPLIILPGTLVRLSSGASIVIRNRLLAEGTPDNPILFVPASVDGDPWGAIALVGKGANGSKLKYVTVLGGSGLKGDLFEYSAMLSIHDVQGVEIENSIFRDNNLTDDMVHVVYSEVTFYQTVFNGSFLDSLDVDISSVVIDACHFVDSGNDSVDLMGSNVAIVDTTIENSGDKAVSVGEQSSLLSINNVFRRNATAVQSKDGSVAFLFNTDLVLNSKALDVYKKNWRYDDGGEIYVHKSYFKGNDKLYLADTHSKIHVYDSYVD